MPQPFDMLITGTVPAGSGLSSSAAMVVASTLAFLTMNKKLDLVNKGDLVKMTMENEKRVGESDSNLHSKSTFIFPLTGVNSGG
jgi:galactokinase